MSELLPINFHKTFLPERRLLGALLEYAALGREGNYQEIARDTGIPMGKSSGKVPAMLDYARGMGLITLVRGGGPGRKRPRLTGFGQVVYAADRYLGRPFSQWLAHMHLCLPRGGAVAWHLVFVTGRRALGSRFAADRVEHYLVEHFGPGRSRTGPLLRTYLEDAALGRAGVLVRQQDELTRRRAPLEEPYALPYAAFILELWEKFFPGREQITADELAGETGWPEMCLWSREELEQALELVEQTGFFTLDRQRRPWILERRAVAADAWQELGRAWEE
ncbi:DUF4007 family protein [Desulfurispora thermophila]|uniref:DUF4007 family protein n=1 Tax=Desulfurispora thermophila TaxID=265470 RepID=UPI000363F80F|nr:hypothetical protein [Desulfurispora thermophila]